MTVVKDCVLRERIAFFPDCSQKPEIVNKGRNQEEPAGGAVCIHNTTQSPCGKQCQSTATATYCASCHHAAHTLLADNDLHHKTFCGLFLSQCRKQTDYSVCDAISVCCGEKGTNTKMLAVTRKTNSTRGDWEDQERKTSKKKKNNLRI